MAPPATIAGAARPCSAPAARRRAGDGRAHQRVLGRIRRHAPAASINIVTKSGGNQFHGEVLELWRPADTEAALSGFTAANATSGNDLTSDTLGQSALVALAGRSASTARTSSPPGEFSREDRASPIISPVAPGIFIGHYRGLAGLPAPGSPDQRPQQSVLPQQRGRLPRHQPQRHRGRQQPAHRGPRLPAAAPTRKSWAKPRC